MQSAPQLLVEASLSPPFSHMRRAAANQVTPVRKVVIGEGFIQKTQWTQSELATDSPETL